MRINWGEHKHSAPRPTGTAWNSRNSTRERDQQGLGQGQTDRRVLHQEGDRLSQQLWVGKSFRPKRRQTWISMAALEREHTWIYTNMGRTAPERRKQGSRRGKAGRVGLGNRTKIQGLKNILFMSENAKAAFNCALHQ